MPWLQVFDEVGYPGRTTLSAARAGSCAGRFFQAFYGFYALGNMFHEDLFLYSLAEANGPQPLDNFLLVHVASISASHALLCSIIAQ